MQLQGRFARWAERARPTAALWTTLLVAIVWVVLHLEDRHHRSGRFHTYAIMSACIAAAWVASHVRPRAGWAAGLLVGALAQAVLEWGAPAPIMFAFGAATGLAAAWAGRRPLLDVVTLGTLGFSVPLAIVRHVGNVALEKTILDLAPFLLASTALALVRARPVIKLALFPIALFVLLFGATQAALRIAWYPKFQLAPFLAETAGTVGAGAGSVAPFVNVFALVALLLALMHLPGRLVARMFEPRTTWLGAGALLAVASVTVAAGGRVPEAKAATGGTLDVDAIAKVLAAERPWVDEVQGWGPDRFLDAACVARQRRLVLVLMEGPRGSHLKRWGGDGKLVPELESFLDRAISPDLGLASTIPTHNGMFATLCGYLPQDGDHNPHAVPGLNERIDCLPKLLGSKGFPTRFYHTGDLAFREKGRFYEAKYVQMIDRSHGFFLDTPIEQRTQWGASDAVLYDRVLADFDANAGGRDAFIVYTLTNHHPWDLPEDRGDFVPPHATPAGEEQAFENTSAYADHELGRFLRALATRDLSDTTIIVTGDHAGFLASPEDDGLTERTGARHTLLPIAVQSPCARERRIPWPVSQLQIAPTVCAALGLKDCPRTMLPSMFDAPKSDLPYHDAYDAWAWWSRDGFRRVDVDAADFLARPLEPSSGWNEGETAPASESEEGRRWLDRTQRLRLLLGPLWSGAAGPR